MNPGSTKARNLWTFFIQPYVSQPSKTIEKQIPKIFKHDGTATMVLL
jgi:hypothetical protein